MTGDGMQSRCAYTRATDRIESRVDRVLVRALATLLWLVLAGSIIAGILSLASSDAGTAPQLQLPW
jgi:hypothetical protein